MTLAVHRLVFACIAGCLLVAQRPTDAVATPSGDARPATSGERTVEYKDLIELVDLGAGPELDRWGVAISPDGTAVAILQKRASVDRNVVDARWTVVSLSRRGYYRDVGSAGDPIVLEVDGVPTGQVPAQRPRWSPDSQWILYRLREGDDVQLWRSRRDGSAREKVTSAPGELTDAFEYSRDGQSVLFVVDRQRLHHAARVASERVRGFLYDDRFSPLLARAEPLNESSHEQEGASVWVHELASHVERRATAAEIEEFEDLTGRVKHGRPVEWLKVASRGGARTWLENRSSPESTGIAPLLTVVAAPSPHEGPVVCTAAMCTGRFKGLWVADNGFVYFLKWQNDREYGALELLEWRPRARTTRRILLSSDLLESCAYTSGELICSHESPATPRKLVKVDLVTGAVSDWYDPNPEFRKLKIGEVRSLTWKDASGVEGYGHLVLPVDYEPGRRYPLIIVQYRSRGFLRGGTGDENPIHIFSARGFAVLSFHRPEDWDLYLSARSPDDLAKSMWRGLRDKRRVYSVLAAGIDALDSMGLVDRNRVGITGLSDGAETASFALLHSRVPFAAASVSSTFYSPILYYLAGERLQDKMEDWGIGDPASPDNLPTWREVSLALNAQRIATPILIQVADHELLPETQTYTALMRANRPVELYVFADEFHVKSQPAHRNSIYRRNVAWFEFWLQNREEADPLDADQYERWRRLRSQPPAAISSNKGPDGK